MHFAASRMTLHVRCLAVICSIKATQVLSLNLFTLPALPIHQTLTKLTPALMAPTVRIGGRRSIHADSHWEHDHLAVNLPPPQPRQQENRLLDKNEDASRSAPMQQQLTQSEQQAEDFLAERLRDVQKLNAQLAAEADQMETTGPPSYMSALYDRRNMDLHASVSLSYYARNLAASDLFEMAEEAVNKGANINLKYFGDEHDLSEYQVSLETPFSKC